MGVVGSEHPELVGEQRGEQVAGGGGVAGIVSPHTAALNAAEDRLIAELFTANATRSWTAPSS